MKQGEKIKITRGIMKSQNEKSSKLADGKSPALPLDSHKSPFLLPKPPAESTHSNPEIKEDEDVEWSDFT